jgi:hypothetical protein
MPDLKLIALDAEDLTVVSAHLQDAVGRIGDLTYDKRARRFAMVLNRFDWVSSNTTSGSVGKGESNTTSGSVGKSEPNGASTAAKTKASASGEFKRRQTGLRFEAVTAVRTMGIDRNRPNNVLSLLAIGFEAGEPPSGTITLVFADGPQIVLEVEYIEAELRDLGAAWATKNRPQHPGDDEL